LKEVGNSNCIWGSESAGLSVLMLLVCDMGKIIYRKGKEFIQEARRGEKPKPIENLSNNLFVKIGMVALSAFLLYNVYRSAVITQEKTEISEKAKEQVNELRVKNLELELILESMQSKEFLEVQARDRLNFSGKNEYVFVIPEGLLEEGKESVDMFLNPPKQEVEDPTYVVWFEFLKNGI